MGKLEDMKAAAAAGKDLPRPAPSLRSQVKPQASPPKPGAKPIKFDKNGKPIKPTPVKWAFLCGCKKTEFDISRFRCPLHQRMHNHAKCQKAHAVKKEFAKRSPPCRLPDGSVKRLQWSRAEHLWHGILVVQGLPKFSAQAESERKCLLALHAEFVKWRDSNPWPESAPEQAPTEPPPAKKSKKGKGPVPKNVDQNGQSSSQ